MPRPTPQAALAKSPKPSTDTTTASSNGDTMKRRRQVRQVVLDRVHLAAKALPGNARASVRLDALALALVADAVQHQRQVRRRLVST